MCGGEEFCTQDPRFCFGDGEAKRLIIRVELMSVFLYKWLFV